MPRVLNYGAGTMVLWFCSFLAAPLGIEPTIIKYSQQTVGIRLEKGGSSVIFVRLGGNSSAVRTTGFPSVGGRSGDDCKMECFRCWMIVNSGFTISNERCLYMYV